MFNRCTSNASTFIRAKAGFSGRFRLAGDPHSWKLHFHSEPEHEAEWGEDVVVRKVLGYERAIHKLFLFTRL
jgi:hypothetical protein